MYGFTVNIGYWVYLITFHFRTAQMTMDLQNQGHHQYLVLLAQSFNSQEQTHQSKKPCLRLRHLASLCGPLQ